MADRSRRQFLESSLWLSALAVAGETSSGSAAQDEVKKPSGRPAGPSEKLGLAVVGAGIRGKVHCDEFSRRSDVEVLVICDADRDVGQKVAEALVKKGHRTRYVQDLREVFEDKSIDAVSIATPNHWHALAGLWAMEAGKDVYLEKPVSHNVCEGRALLDMARRHNRICQTGTQCRSMRGTIDAIHHVRSGAIGQVKLARGLCYNPRGSIGARGSYQPPEAVNYDLWSGPAPLLPVSRKQFHYDWHWQWPYGNGDLGNQGIHQMDLARWGLGISELSQRVLSYGGRFGDEDAGDTPNTQVVVHDFPEATIVFEVRGLKTSPLRGAAVGVIFYGSEGYVVLTSYTSGAAFDLDGKLVRNFNGGGDHFGNFVDAVRSRRQEDLAADIQEGHLSSALCHLGNISWRLGEPRPADEFRSQLSARQHAEDAMETFDRFTDHLKENGVDSQSAKLVVGEDLQFDPQRESFVDHPQADVLLTREYRAPFDLPKFETKKEPHAEIAS